MKELFVQERRNTEKCLSILVLCRTRHEILSGFNKIAKLLRETNDPLYEGAEKIAMQGGILPDEYVVRLKEDFIAQCRAFLSSTRKRVTDKTTAKLPSKQFEGKTVEEAKEAAMAAFPEERIVSLKVTSKGRKKTIQRKRESSKEAVEAVKSGVPSEVSDVGSEEIIEQGQRGTVEVLAHSEDEARTRWRDKAPRGSSCEHMECVRAPARGILRIFTRQGLWRVHWSTKFKARISYRTPVVVTVWYRKNAPSAISEKEGSPIIPSDKLVFRICVCTFDQEHALFAEEYKRYDSLAKEAEQYGDAIVPALASSVSKGPFVHKALAYVGTSKAVEVLIDELSKRDWRRVEAAANALNLTANQDALPALKAAQKSTLHQHIAEVHAALAIAISSLQRKAKGEEWLDINEHDPLEQIRMVAMQRDTLNETQRLATIEWTREMIRTLPDLQARDTISPNSRKAIAWNLLAITTYYLQWPRDCVCWDHPCPEAKTCWEHACELDPENSQFKESLGRIAKIC